MLTNYLRIALRYLLKNKVYSLINIAGLSLSLACAMLMILYTKDELTFDRFHREAESLFLITIDVRMPDGSSMEKMGETGLLQGPTFAATIPEVESFCRSMTMYRDIKVGDNVQNQLVMIADTNFFSMFTFPLLSGNPHLALKAPNNVVLSEDAAIQYFGTTDVLNKTILIGKGEYQPNDRELTPYVVSAVSKRCPQNSSLQFDMLIKSDLPPEQEQDPENWTGIGANTFVRLKPRSDVEAVAKKMQSVFERESKKVWEKVRAGGFTQSFYHELQPITDLHLNPDEHANRGITNGSKPVYSYVLSGIAAFILAIACINFINLTIARSVRRAKEIGIRKVIGGARKQLIAQFLGETFLIASLSFAAAILISQLLLPWFNNIINKQLSLSYLLDTKLITVYIVLFLITGLLAGFYPAIVLSGYSPVQTLYNQFKIAGSNFLQKSLIVFQFTLATVMIVATITLFQQFNFLTTKDLGYNADHVVDVRKRFLTWQEANVFRGELLKSPGVISVAPQGISEMNAKINGDSIQHFAYEVVDENFVNLLDIPVVQGRNFSAQFPSDSSQGIIVNEAFVKMAHWKEPIGEKINMFLYGEKEYRTVVGVIRDYHFASLSDKIGPQALAPISYPSMPYGHMLVRIRPGSESTSLPTIEATFKKLFPMTPYSYQFTDEINRKNYDRESKWKTVIFASAVTTIFIACIGLLGLSMLTTERRFKEIGIRKVMGASVKSIVLTLSKDFVLLIATALLIAMPFAWYAVNKWLETYPYRTELTPLLFIGAGLLVLVIAMLTTGYHSVRAGRMNPVEAIRRE